jgi:HlyD family secretion protein
VVVHTRNVEVGARVNESSVLATLVGTDAFWLRLTLPVDQLTWLTIPTGAGEKGSEVRIYPQGGSAGAFRLGEITRLEPALESQGRMAQILVKIDDPLCFLPENRGKPVLLLGSFVRAELLGATVASGISLDRSHLHDGNRVWLMNGEGQLEIREVEVLFRNRGQVVVGKGLQSGERLVTTQISSPVAGIPLRLADSGMKRKGDQPAGAPGARPKAKETGGDGNAQ